MASSEGFDGLASLVADLARMGEDVHREAAVVVRSAAEAMKADVQGRYPSREGVLRTRVVAQDASQGAATDSTSLRWKVRSKAPHAHLYEFGTVRRYTAGSGADRGTMPAKPTFIPAAVYHRRRMVDDLVRVVRRQRVRGMTGTMEVK